MMPISARPFSKPRLTPAAADLQNLSDRLKERSPRYRQPTIRKTSEKIQTLKETPHIGRPGRIEGTWELLFLPMPYAVVYRVYRDSIEVWRIWQTSQSRG